MSFLEIVRSETLNSFPNQEFINRFRVLIESIKARDAAYTPLEKNQTSCDLIRLTKR